MSGFRFPHFLATAVAAVLFFGSAEALKQAAHFQAERTAQQVSTLSADIAITFDEAAD